MAEHFTITRKDGGVLVEGRIETRYTMAELCSTLRELGLVLPYGDTPPIAGDPDRVVTSLHAERTTSHKVGEIEYTERFTNKIHFGGTIEAAEVFERCYNYWGEHEKRCTLEEGHPGPCTYAGTCGNLIQYTTTGVPDGICRMAPGHEGDCHG